MNTGTAKLINRYSEITGKRSRSVKRWWNSLMRKDRCKSRRSMGVIVSAHQKKLRRQRDQAAAA